MKVFKPGDKEVMHDVRGSPKPLNLDTNGLTLDIFEHQREWFNDPSLVEKYYIPGITRLLEKQCNGKIHKMEWQVCGMELWHWFH